MCEMWSEDRSKGLEHARRAKKRPARGQNIVGVDGSETRNTGLHTAFFSRGKDASLESLDTRDVYLTKTREKDRPCGAGATNQEQKGESEGENKCREDKCHRDRPLIYYGGSE